MTTIKLTGWRVGMRKVSLTHCLQERVGLSLSQAKSAVDDVLAGKEVALDIPPEQDTATVVAAVRELGAIFETED